MPDDPSVAPATRLATAVTGGAYELPVYPFVQPAELRGQLGRHPVVIVGAGLAGLTAACDLAQRGIPAVLLDEDDTVGVRGAASRGICYQQKSLEIFQRLGIYQRIRAKGVQWSVGRTMAGDDEIFHFDLNKLAAHDVSEQPPFINLQQFYVEWYLVDRLYELGTVELRWKNRVLGIQAHADHVSVQVDTPAGAYTLQTQWLLDCTGAHSPVRAWAAVALDESAILDRWCISDVRFAHTPAAECWTWIEAPFNDNRAVWQHLMADDVWRLEYQMAPDADPDQLSGPAVVAERLRRQFGDDIAYELVWVGPYAYRSQCLQRLRAGRVLFAGDAAHVMSPFGARGGNSGIQDADNLGWKLALVLEGHAPEALLDTYADERLYAAQENIRITRRTTRFLSPASAVERAFRAAVIGLAREYPFARALVNTGRLSTPTRYPLQAAGALAGRSVQNIALQLPAGRNADLIELQQQAPDFLLGLLPAALAPALAAALRTLEQRYPVRFYAVGTTAAPAADAGALPVVADVHGGLAAQLGRHQHDLVLLRPDLHLAALLPAPSAAAAELAVRAALALD